MIKEVKSLKDYFVFFQGVPELAKNETVLRFLNSYRTISTGCSCKKQLRIRACNLYRTNAIQETLMKFKKNILDFLKISNYKEIRFYLNPESFKSIKIDEQ